MGIVLDPITASFGGKNNQTFTNARICIVFCRCIGNRDFAMNGGWSWELRGQKYRHSEHNFDLDRMEAVAERGSMRFGKHIDKLLIDRIAAGIMFYSPSALLLGHSLLSARAGNIVTVVALLSS